MAVVTPLRPPETPPTRIRPRRFYRRDAVVLGGAVAASFSLVWLIYTQLLPFSGAFGFILCWLVTFLAMYYVAVRETDGKIVARDRAMAALITVVAIGIVIPLALILGYVAYKGLSFLRLAFFTTTSATVTPDTPARRRGPAGDRGNTRTGGHRDDHLRAARDVHGHVHQRGGRPPATAGADLRGHDERGPVDRRWSVHLRGLDARPRSSSGSRHRSRFRS